MFRLQTVKQHRYLMSAFYEFSTAMLLLERERVCNGTCNFIRILFKNLKIPLDIDFILW